MSAQLVDTKKVTGRRSVSYTSLDQLMSDAQELASGNHKTLGNWSYGQILDHLARGIRTAVDGGPLNFPAPIQFVLKLLMLKRMTTRPMAPGFKLPKKASSVLPDDVTTEQGLANLRESVSSYQSADKLAKHGGFGTITREQWTEFNLRHAEMHMSFVVPQ